MVTRWDVTRAVRKSDLPSAARLVVFVLADLADNDTAVIPYERTPSLTSLAEETGLGRSTVARELKRLDKDGWVTRKAPRKVAAWSKKERTQYRLDVPAGFWDGRDQGQMTSPTAGLVPERDQSVVPERDYSSPRAGLVLVPQRDLTSPTAGHVVHPLTPSKPPLTSVARAPQTTAKKSEPIRADVERVCNHLADRIEGNGSQRPSVTAIWRREARLMIDREGRTVEQITKAIDWCQDHPFWRANVMSMPKLREKYDQMRLQASQHNGATNGARATLPPSSAPTVIPPAERCPDHRGEIKGKCRHCRAIAIGRPQEIS